jgi:hypothetical protein
LARTRLSGGGDYVPPDANVVARRLFIDGVARLAPEALEELRALAPHLPDGDGLTLAPETFELERPLRRWCVTHGFTAVRWAPLDRDHTGTTHLFPCGPDWLLHLARKTAQWVRTCDDPRNIAEVIQLCVTASYAPVDAPPPPRWNIDLETEEAFIARQAQYRRQVKHVATAAGRTLAHQFNQPQTAERDFGWLALFQVGRCEMVTIRARCKSPRPSLDTIRDAIAQAAHASGIHLRAARRGRPREV